MCVCFKRKKKEKRKEPLIAAHICVSSWALGAPMQPISPHQTHSLGLSVNTNTQTHRLNVGATQTHTGQINKVEGKHNNKGKKNWEETKAEFNIIQ